jgi:uncharacterized protein (DUF362 family)
MAARKRSYGKVAVFGVAGVILLFTAISLGSGKITLAGLLSTAAEVPNVPVKKEYGNTIDQLKVKVAVVKSDSAYAANIKYPEILRMVREAVNLSGGLGHLVTDGKTVLLKPNIVNDYPNRTIEVNGATTDYRVVQAVVQIVRELNPSGKIILAEGSGGDLATMQNLTRLKYLDITGIDYVMTFEAFSGEYRDFQSDSLIAVSLPDSLTKYPDTLKPNQNRKIYYNKRYFQADVVISIPVLKNHGRAGVTGGVKNVGIGCTPANLYADKTDAKPYLRSTVIVHDEVNLDKWIHDYYIGRPVDFVIMDALQGGSSGPGVGGNNLTAIKRNQHNMRLILAGRDAVATDAVAGLIIGHDPQRANHLVYIHNSGFGTVDPALIDVIGVKVHSVRKFFGFDGSFDTPTAFTKALSADYQVSGTISNNILHLSVSNPEDLARISVKIDNQKINKYVVGGFNDITLGLDGIQVTRGEVEVFFEDRYLNPLTKTFTAQNLTSVYSPANNEKLSLFPNPADAEVYLRLENSKEGLYRIFVVDLSGRLVLLTDHVNTSGYFEHTLSLVKLTPGNYVIRMECPDGYQIHSRFIKR